MKKDKILFLDIETAPAVASYENLGNRMKSLWNTKSLFIDPHNLLFDESYADRAGIYSEFGKVICICCGYFHKDEFRLKCISSHEESEVLSGFFAICNSFFQSDQHRFCGHNIREFDIPFIARRGLINNLQLPRIIRNLQRQKPWEIPLLDTLQLWKFGDYKHYTSLELLAEVFGLDSPKEDLRGSDVGHVYWQEKNLYRIETYCKQDVITTAKVFLKMTDENADVNFRINHIEWTK